VFLRAALDPASNDRRRGALTFDDCSRHDLMVTAIGARKTG
jgi:hypothetical protein